MGAWTLTPRHSSIRRRADELARDRCDDSAATHTAQRGDGPILGDEDDPLGASATAVGRMPTRVARTLFR